MLIFFIILSNAFTRMNLYGARSRRYYRKYPPYGRGYYNDPFDSSYHRGSNPFGSSFGGGSAGRGSYSGGFKGGGGTTGGGGAGRSF